MASLKSVVEVSKSWYQSTLPILYRTVTIPVEHSSTGEPISNSLQNLAKVSSERLQHVKSLAFFVPPPRRGRGWRRCPHNFGIYVENGELVGDPVELSCAKLLDNVMESFGKDVVSLLRLLKNDSLHRFR